MWEVIIHDDENFGRAPERFERKCERAGIPYEIRKHGRCEKPSVRRRRRMNAPQRTSRRSRRA